MFEVWKGKLICLCYQCRWSFYADRLKCFTVTPSWIFWDKALFLSTQSPLPPLKQKRMSLTLQLSKQTLCFASFKMVKTQETLAQGLGLQGSGGGITMPLCMISPVWCDLVHRKQQTKKKTLYLFLPDPASFTQREVG